MLIVTDNIDVACATIEKAAMGRAVAEVDDAFSIDYADCRLHCEEYNPMHQLVPIAINAPQQRNDQLFWNSSIISSDFLARLPEPLQLQTNVLLDQLRVNSDFGSPTVVFIRP